MPTPLFRSFRFFALGLAVLAAFAVTACDSDDDSDADALPAGTFEARASGELSGTLSGPAQQGVVTDAEGAVGVGSDAAFQVVMADTTGEIVTLVLLIQRADEAPEEGNYDMANGLSSLRTGTVPQGAFIGVAALISRDALDDIEDADDLDGLVIEGDTFLATGGTVRIREEAGTRVRGTFSFDAVAFRGLGSIDEDSRLRLEGAFNATQVEDVAQPVAGRAAAFARSVLR